jgi:hypothetical protein
LAARGDAENVLRHQPFQRQRGVADPARFGPERDLPHVGDVEQPGGLPCVQVFLQHAGRVLHRHLVARERNQLAAQRDMQRVERGSSQGIGVVARKHHRALAVFRG